MRRSLIWILVFLLSSCQAQITEQQNVQNEMEQELILETGADRLLNQLDELQAKKVAMVVNPTSVVGDRHIVDLLLEKGIDIQFIFAPEHGFRGKADAGEKVKDGVDLASGLKIVSLYGNHKKPTSEDLLGIDLLVFDIQDVGVRFYTYISTLHYVMEACAENGVEVWVLDRPNPNGHLVDGNILDLEYQSFVGMHPIPILHGMTIGEYALMINGESWLKNGVQCDLKVIPCEGYTHQMRYSLPIKPSPNLRDDRSIAVYPSTCFFEGTVISEGRGTDYPFQYFGSPKLAKELTEIEFVPIKNEGAKYPKLENQTCYGFSIVEEDNAFPNEEGINLHFLITVYNLFPDKENFFLTNGFFDLLAGGTELREMIVEGKTAEEIKSSWQEDLSVFKQIRKNYLLYPDFE